MLGLTCSNLIGMFIGWHIVLENLKKKVLLMPVEPWDGVKLVMILMKACSKLCNKPWEGMFSFFVFSISCHFVLNVTKGNARVRKDSLCVQPITGAIIPKTIDNLNWKYFFFSKIVILFVYLLCWIWMHDS